MDYCPSQDWDRFCEMNEPPEDCPMCGEPNWDVDTEQPVCPEAIEFCSTKCRDEYVEEQKRLAEWEEKELEWLDAEAAAWEAKMDAEYIEGAKEAAEDEKSSEEFFEECIGKDPCDECSRQCCCCPPCEFNPKFAELFDE